MSKKYIITGASGFIGSALAKRLLYDGHKVWAIGRNKEKLDELKQYGSSVTVVADFDDYHKLPELIFERGFDNLIHLAWNGTSASALLYDNYENQLNNVKISCDIAAIASELECTTTTTTTTYQMANANILKNTKPIFNPIVYGICQKTASELFRAICYKNKISVTTLIFPNVFGTNDKKEASIPFFIKKLQNNEDLDLISGKYKDDWIHLDDLVNGIVKAINSNAQNLQYYVGHREISTFKEKLIEMKAVFNSNSKLNFGKYPENYFVDYSKFDLDALYKDTGWEAKISFRDAILKVRDSLI
jgi:nucleoside-diphosphate-sugar epimerase